MVPNRWRARATFALAFGHLAVVRLLPSPPGGPTNAAMLLLTLRLDEAINAPWPAMLAPWMLWELLELAESGALPPDMYPPDVIARARLYIDSIGSVGAYSDSQGALIVRQEIAAFLRERDGIDSEAADVFLTDGAVNFEAEMLQLIAERLGPARLFMVGIGSAPNGYFMSRAAEIGRGRDAVQEAAVGPLVTAALGERQADVGRRVVVAGRAPAVARHVDAGLGRLALLPPTDLLVTPDVVLTRRRLGAAVGGAGAGEGGGRAAVPKRV